MIAGIGPGQRRTLAGTPNRHRVGIIARDVHDIGVHRLLGDQVMRSGRDRCSGGRLGMGLLRQVGCNGTEDGHGGEPGQDVAGRARSHPALGLLGVLLSADGTGGYR
jgi:hypothetical protein